MEPAEDLVDGKTHRIVELPPGQPFGHGIQILHIAVSIGRRNAVTDRLQRDLRALLLAEQRLFIEFALGDVGFDADEPLHPLVVADSRLNPALDPPPVTVRMPHAVHTLEQRGPAFQMLPELGLDTCQIVRVHELLPVRHVLVGRITEHRAPPRREKGAARAIVVVPETVVGGVRHELIALAHDHQVFLQPNSLEPAGATRADQLEGKLHIGLPFRIRNGAQKPEQPARLAVQIETDEQDARDLASCQDPCVLFLARFGTLGVGNLEQAQMLQP